MMMKPKVVVSPARCAAADTMLSLLCQQSCDPPSLNNAVFEISQRGGILLDTPSPRPVMGRTSSVSSASSVTSQSSRGSYRKDKSLGSLCQKFLLLYSTLKQHYISLDIAAHNLKIERRRIYDVVNVLESVSIVVRRAKNCYSWKGFENVNECLEEIRNKENVTIKNPQVHTLKVSPIVTSSKSFTSERGNNLLLSTPDSSKSKSEAQQKSSGGRRAKSLGRLSRRFIALFLNYKPVLSLEEAATQILAMDAVVILPQNLRTKVRRLYDIANVLSSIGLIVKCKTMTATNKSQKPAFRWIGSVDSSYLDAEKVAQQVRDFNLLDDVKTDESDARYRSLDNVTDAPPSITTISTKPQNDKTKQVASVLTAAPALPVMPTIPKTSIEDNISSTAIASTLPYISSNVRTLST